jgi:hypothetical protein
MEGELIVRFVFILYVLGFDACVVFQACRLDLVVFSVQIQ